MRMRSYIDRDAYIIHALYQKGLSRDVIEIILKAMRYDPVAEAIKEALNRPRRPKRKGFRHPSPDIPWDGVYR